MDHFGAVPAFQASSDVELNLTMELGHISPRPERRKAFMAQLERDGHAVGRDYFVAWESVFTFLRDVRNDVSDDVKQLHNRFLDLVSKYVVNHTHVVHAQPKLPYPVVRNGRPLLDLTRPPDPKRRPSLDSIASEPTPRGVVHRSDGPTIELVVLYLDPTFDVDPTVKHFVSPPLEPVFVRASPSDTPLSVAAAVAKHMHAPSNLDMFLMLPESLRQLPLSAFDANKNAWCEHKLRSSYPALDTDAQTLGDLAPLLSSCLMQTLCIASHHWTGRLDRHFMRNAQDRWRLRRDCVACSLPQSLTESLTQLSQEISSQPDRLLIDMRLFISLRSSVELSLADDIRMFVEKHGSAEHLPPRVNQTSTLECKMMCSAMLGVPPSEGPIGHPEPHLVRLRSCRVTLFDGLHDDCPSIADFSLHTATVAAMNQLHSDSQPPGRGDKAGGKTGGKSSKAVKHPLAITLHQHDSEVYYIIVSGDGDDETREWLMIFLRELRVAKQRALERIALCDTILASPLTPEQATSADVTAEKGLTKVDLEVTKPAAATSACDSSDGSSDSSSSQASPRFPNASDAKAAKTPPLVPPLGLLAAAASVTSQSSAGYGLSAASGLGYGLHTPRAPRARTGYGVATRNIIATAPKQAPVTRPVPPISNMASFGGSLHAVRRERAPTWESTTEDQSSIISPSSSPRNVPPPTSVNWARRGSRTDSGASPTFPLASANSSEDFVPKEGPIDEAAEFVLRKAVKRGSRLKKSRSNARFRAARKGLASGAITRVSIASPVVDAGLLLSMPTEDTNSETKRRDKRKSKERRRSKKDLIYRSFGSLPEEEEKPFKARRAKRVQPEADGAKQVRVSFDSATSAAATPSTRGTTSSTTSSGGGVVDAVAVGKRTSEEERSPPPSDVPDAPLSTIREAPDADESIPDAASFKDDAQPRSGVAASPPVDDVALGPILPGGPPSHPVRLKKKRSVLSALRRRSSRSAKERMMQDRRSRLIEREVYHMTDDEEEEEEETPAVSGDVSGGASAHESSEETIDDEPFNFNSKFQECLVDVAEADRKELVSSYTDLIRLSEDFLTYSRRYGRIIVSEVFLPLSRKSLKPIEIGGSIGGQKYIVHNILFKFALDEGFFGGNHAFAAKVAGHELKGLKAYFRTGVPGLHYPLMALIDYKGFRIVATSLLPLGKGSLIYGSEDAGHTIHRSDPELNKRIRLASEQLNLKLHSCGYGDKRITMHSAVDLEGHIGEDGKYYLLDFSRVFPPVKPQGKRPNSHLYEMFRPEFVKRFRLFPLCSDAYSWFVASQPDALDHMREVDTATADLMGESITHFVEELIALLDEELTTIGRLDNFPLTETLHRRGINVRYLGLVVRRMGNHKYVPIVLVNLVARILKVEMRALLREHMRMLKEPLDEPYRMAITDFLNLVFSRTRESRVYWNTTIRKRMDSKFDLSPQTWLYYPADMKRSLYRVFWFSRSEVYDARFNLLHQLRSMTGLVFTPDLIEQLQLFPPTFNQSVIFSDTDVIELGDRVKHMDVVSNAKGYVYTARGVEKEKARLYLAARQLYARALDAFRQSLKSSPQDPTLLSNCARTLIKIDHLNTLMQQTSWADANAFTDSWSSTPGSSPMTSGTDETSGGDTEGGSSEDLYSSVAGVPLLESLTKIRASKRSNASNLATPSWVNHPLPTARTFASPRTTSSPNMLPRRSGDRRKPVDRGKSEAEEDLEVRIRAMVKRTRAKRKPSRFRSHREDTSSKGASAGSSPLLPRRGGSTGTIKFKRRLVSVERAASVRTLAMRHAYPLATVRQARVSSPLLVQAKSFFTKALQSDPRNATIHHSFALLLESLGEVEATEDHYLAALRRNPNARTCLADYALFLECYRQSEYASKFNARAEMLAGLMPCRVPGQQMLFRADSLATLSIDTLPRTKVSGSDAVTSEDVSAGLSGSTDFE